MDSASPSIKGTGFASAVADLEALLESGRLDETVLEARLEAEDLDLIEAKVLPGDWVAIESYGRLIDLLCAVDGGGDPHYHVRRGRTAAERLMSSGIYHQLDKAQRMKEGSETDDWHESVARVMLTMSRALFNFMAWEYRRDPGEAGFEIEVTGAEALPEGSRLTIQGVIEYTTEALGVPSDIQSSRPEPGRILYQAFQRD